MPAKTMSSAQFKNALRKLDLTLYSAGPVLGISRSSAYRMAADADADDHQDVPTTVARLLTLLVERGSIPDDWR